MRSIASILAARTDDPKQISKSGGDKGKDKSTRCVLLSLHHFYDVIDIFRRVRFSFDSLF